MLPEEQNEGAEEMIEDLEAPAAMQTDVVGGGCISPTCIGISSQVGVCKEPTCMKTGIGCVASLVVVMDER